MTVVLSATSTKSNENFYRLIAEAIIRSTHLLVTAGKIPLFRTTKLQIITNDLPSPGAGFSADSGLPVYDDIAKVPAYLEAGFDYEDLCKVRLLQSNPAVGYGFWGHCFNQYRDTNPHEGYSILKNW